MNFAKMKLRSAIAVALLMFSSSARADQTTNKFIKSPKLDKSLEKWIPREIEGENRDVFKKKFFKLADKAKSSAVELQNRVTPIVGNHPAYQVFDYGSLIRQSIYADYLNLYFSYTSAENLVAGFAFQLMNDLFLYNIEDCTFWTFDSLSDFINGFLLLIEDNRAHQALISFGYGLHKLPVAYYSCYYAVSDYDSVVLFYTSIQISPALWGQFVTEIVWKLFFNWVDLIYEFVTLENAVNQRQWTMIGMYCAKIMSDVFFKDPTDISWNYKNSDVLNSEWGESPNLLQGINELWEYWGLGSFLSDDQKQSDNVRPRDAEDIFKNPQPQNTIILRTNSTQTVTINEGNSSTIIINSARPQDIIVKEDYVLEYAPGMNTQAEKDDWYNMKDRAANLKTLAKCVKENLTNEELRDNARKIRSMLTATYEPEQVDKLLEQTITTMC